MTPDRAGVVRALATARTFVARAGLDRDAAERLAVIVEEWVGNVAEHGEAPAASRIVLRLESAGGFVRLTISDAGRAFDPRPAAFAGPDPVRGGGAGLELIRAWSRIAGYRRRRGRNQVVLEMPLA